jgi:poly-gamma-glutamate synthesis protein (capsule biosynthesis protein)
MERRKFMVNVARATALAAAANAIPNRLFAVSEKITLAALGDCILSRKVSALKDPQFLKIIEIIRSADCAWANCEHPLVDISATYPEDWGADFPIYCEPWGADELKWVGIDCVGLANNHTRDYGHKGILSTIEHLKRVGIGYAGAGKNLEFAAMPGYVDTAGGRVGQVNCAGSFQKGSHASMPHPYVNGRPGLNPLKFQEVVQITEEQFSAMEKIEEDIMKYYGYEKPKKEKITGDDKKKEEEKPKRELRLYDTKYVPGERFGYTLTYDKKDLERVTDNIKIARRNSRLVIASIHEHVGSEQAKAPTKALEEFARACIDAGADAFFGSGPHRLWGIEIYKKKPIFYSLGNFFFHNGGGGQYPPELYQRFDLPFDSRDTTLLDEQAVKKYFNNSYNWESIVPFITYTNGNELKEIKLYPVVLGMKEPVFRQGTPALADKNEAGIIIDKLAKLSEPYRTAIEFKKGAGVINL